MIDLGEDLFDFGYRCASHLSDKTLAMVRAECQAHLDDPESNPSTRRDAQAIIDGMDTAEAEARAKLDALYPKPASTTPEREP